MAETELIMIAAEGRMPSVFLYRYKTALSA